MSVSIIRNGQLVAIYGPKEERKPFYEAKKAEILRTFPGCWEKMAAVVAARLAASGWRCASFEGDELLPTADFEPMRSVFPEDPEAAGRFFGLFYLEVAIADTAHWIMFKGRVRGRRVDGAQYQRAEAAQRRGRLA